MIQQDDNRTVFDGYCYRQYNADIDGWRDLSPTSLEFPIIETARQILDMAEEINRLRIRVWELEKEVASRPSTFTF